MDLDFGDEAKSRKLIHIIICYSLHRFFFSLLRFRYSSCVLVLICGVVVVLEVRCCLRLMKRNDEAERITVEFCDARSR